MCSTKILLLGVAAVLMAVLITSSTADDICTLAKVSGPCRGFFIRYFYNTATSKCEEFVFGGCYGNSNNFETVQDCQTACVTV